MADAVLALERAELDAFADLYQAAAPAVAAACGLSVTKLGGAVLLAANKIDVLALNRVLGLGLAAPVSAAQVDDVIAAFVRAGAPRYFVQVAPLDGHTALIARLEQHGLRHYNNWMRLRRDVHRSTLPPVDPSSELVVKEIDDTEAGTFGRIVATAFGYPPSLAPLTTQPIGRPGWHYYLAYEGGTPIAASAMYVAGEAAWFGFAATDAAYRRRGAQQALVIRRLRDAADAGCAWVSVETAEDTVTKDAPSFRNLRRLGFEIAYTRPNYLWTKA